MKVCLEGEESELVPFQVPLPPLFSLQSLLANMEEEKQSRRRRPLLSRVYLL